MRNVTIVVPVLITSCHVSLKPKRGPLIAQIKITTTADVNTRGRPQNRDALFANAEYQLPLRMARLLDAGTCRRSEAMQLSGRAGYFGSGRVQHRGRDG